MKAAIIYWSGTGNTEKMAGYISEGIKEAGAEAVIIPVGVASPQDVLNCDVVALGCSSMGAEVLEETEFEPFMALIEGSLSGKKIALFGSYGWGDGEWMRNWVERVNTAGAVLVTPEGLIVNEEPAGSAIDECKDLGKAIARA